MESIGTIVGIILLILVPYIVIKSTNGMFDTPKQKLGANLIIMTILIIGILMVFEIMSVL